MIDNSSALLTALLAFLAVLFVVVGLGRSRSDLQSLIQEMDLEKPPQSEVRERFAEKIIQRLALAGWNIKLTELLWLELLATGGIGLFILAAVHLGVFSFVLALAIVISVTVAIMHVNQFRRAHKIETQLVRAVMIMSSLLASSGATAKMALNDAGERVGAPLGPELKRISDAVEVGANLADAVDDATPRIGSTEWVFFAKAIRLQEEKGGDLAAMLEKIGNTLTTRIRSRGKARSLLAEVQMSQWVLSAAVPLSLLLMAVSDPSQVHLLFTKYIDLAILAAVLWVLGTVSINLMIRRIKI